MSTHAENTFDLGSPPPPGPVDLQPPAPKAAWPFPDGRVQPLLPVEGDLLPSIGEKVLIYLASRDAWVEHEVIGYYVWGDHGGNKHLHRVNVRVKDKDGILNSRMLKGVIRMKP